MVSLADYRIEQLKVFFSVFQIRLFAYRHEVPHSQKADTGLTEIWKTFHTTLVYNLGPLEQKCRSIDRPIDTLTGDTRF